MGIETKVNKMVTEHGLLRKYFDINQQMRVHIIICEKCRKPGACNQMAAIAEDVRKQHTYLEAYFVQEEKNGTRSNY